MLHQTHVVGSKKTLKFDGSMLKDGSHYSNKCYLTSINNIYFPLLVVFLPLLLASTY